MIADGLKSKDVRWVDINRKHFEKVRIAANIHEADSMIVMSHFKGHIMGGFGGAVKNLAMGGASAYGKMDQHSVRPEVVERKCIGCRTCMPICPVDAHIYENGKVRIDKEEWRAESDDESVIEAGTRIEVMRLDGTHAVVKRLSDD